MLTEVSAPPRAIRRVVHAAKKTPPRIDVYEVTPEKPHKLRVVSDTLYSVWIHQSGRRPLPCYGDDHVDCQHHRLPLKQQHWLFVMEPNSVKVQLLRLTSGLVYQVLPELSNPDANLNGLMLELWREHKTKLDSAMVGKILTAEACERWASTLPNIEWAVQRMLEAPDRVSPWARRSSSAPPHSKPPVNDTTMREDPELRALLMQALSAQAVGKQHEAEQIMQKKEELKREKEGANV